MALRVYKKDMRVKERRIATYISYVSLTVGTLLLFWAFYPVISFELYSRIFFKTALSPVPVAHATGTLEYASNVSDNKLTYSNNVRDFTQASMWFPTAIKPAEQPHKKDAIDENVVAAKKPPLKEFYLSISKLNIKDAHVQVGGENLATSLIHYLPVTMPGENGNVVVFGHSTLPQLYNVHDYKTIFTYLPSLNKGDKIQVKTNDSTYEYEVYDMFVIKPDQISVLDQNYDQANLTLITCVPPGTYWNRLIVKAKLTALPTTL